MATPFSDFESNFRSAETLLKVFRLLDTPDGPQTTHVLLQGVRDLLMAGDDEEIILLVNELFLGAVRESADMRAAVFKRESLNMLLRQGVVAACSAIDVYYPALLRAHLPKVIQVKQRNFMPTDRQTRDFLKDLRLSLDECLRMLSDPHPETILGDLVVDNLKRKTLSNKQGVAVVLQILGVEEPWDRIAERLGQPRDALERQFEALVSRRNDIIHRGDRGSADPNGPVQAIALAWTDNHVRTAKSVALASRELVDAQMELLGTAEAVVPPNTNG